MRFFVIFFALFAFASACLGGGSQCCPPAQPACGNPCGGGIGPAPIGPAAYPVANAYPVAGK
ncbi:hypothetical protein CRE_23908 [Caenorhabditis remanei]|uniref:Uncharacterized protein n=2 Tax=Caenorhabditis remanei TaxID=31234 RepID=E3MGE0_CAERE|nr:hypothetical protein CRE_23908 [Caenorhabditis remanei]